MFRIALQVWFQHRAGGGGGFSQGFRIPKACSHGCEGLVHWEVGGIAWHSPGDPDSDVMLTEKVESTDVRMDGWITSVTVKR